MRVDMNRPARAIVRPPGKTYPRGLTRIDPPPPVDLALAARQHAGYVAALRSLGLEVLDLPADDAHPDAVFVQDRAAIVDGRAMVAPSAVESRRGEEEPIVALLDGRFPIVTLERPASLDWGDVLITEDALYVGLSERSNRQAAEQLREMLAPGRAVETVPTPADLLHLLSGCAYLGSGKLLSVESLAPFARERGLEVVPVAPDEALAANALALGRDVVVPDGYPETRRRIEAAGLRTVAVPVSEFEKRDGGVTCLSIVY